MNILYFILRSEPLRSYCEDVKPNLDIEQGGEYLKGLLNIVTQ
jgi:hypothetical protein